MTIYAKTNAGRLLAYDNTLSVPAALRNLLRKMDGKTHQHELVTGQTDASLMQELIERDLVQVVSSGWRDSSYVSSQSDSHAPRVPFFAATEPAGLVDELKVSSSLKIAPAKALMSDFVSTYLPEYADATMREIEALRNKADLLCMLSGYIDLVQRTGKPGQQHVQQLLLAVVDCG